MEKRTPSRTDLEKFTPDEIIEKFGFNHYLVAFVKSFKTHDADRYRRKREKAEKAQKKKQSRTFQT